MITKKATLIYLITYLALGGLGLALFPELALELLQAEGNYGLVMPRMVGMFMCALSFLVYRILKFEDWKYYITTIYVRTAIVLFMLWLYTDTTDPLFLILVGVVILGLIPSVIIYFSKHDNGTDVKTQNE